MKVLIVAKTRQGAGACIGAITSDGASARLIAPPSADERWGLEFEVGDVWEIEARPASSLTPPHVENVVVTSRRKLKSVDPTSTILKYMPPKCGGTEALYEGVTRTRPKGALYIAESSGVPPYSTMFWRPNRPLRADIGGKRIRYFYSGDAREASLVFVGFQEPVHEIPAGSLLRISLSHWWNSPEFPDEELKCWVQLSGWFGDIRSEPLGPHLSAARPAHGQRATVEAARQAMARVFGFDTFRPLQEEIIGGILGGKDCLGIMPTGAGKSLCYQLPAIVLDGLTVVVSPLISLMQDQIDQLSTAGVPAVTLNSLLPYAEYADNIRQVRGGHARLLYVAPETLLRPEIIALLEERGVSLFTIDEAHCISEWGHDFRPEYRQLRPVRDRFPKASCLALTATATERVREDIRRILGIDPAHTFVSGFDRPNLFIDVQRRQPTTRQLMKFLEARRDQSGIVYCATRSQVDQLTVQLNEAGFQALPYHAGLEDGVRRRNQREFLNDNVQIAVATIAFGMGINKSNVRFVVHTSLPQCIETYYQQIGRAGRDGLRSDCLLLYSRADLVTLLRFVEEAAEDQRAGRAARMNEMLRLAESQNCRRAKLLAYFGDPPPDGPCGMCDRCVMAGADAPTVDVSADARLLLGCIRELRERFGMAHVIDVLRASHSSRVVKWSHDRLASHGAGKHRSKEEWRLLADRFMDLGLVEAELEHGAIRLTDGGRRVLGGEPVFVTEVQAEEVAEVADRSTHDAVLFEKLRKLRKQLADEAGVAPFVVFSDRALVEMCTAYPRTLSEFLRISGVGERKMAIYGEQFISIIAGHVEENGIAPTPEAPQESTWYKTGKRRYKEVASEWLAGRSIDEIASMRGVKRSTIVNHLCDFVHDGGKLDPDRLFAECDLPAAQLDQALQLFEQLGDRNLGPIREALGGAVSYTELHLLRLYRMSL